MNRKTNSLPLAFTMGDAAGIGPEIILKLYQQGITQATVVYGDKGILEKYNSLYKLGLNIIQLNDINEFLVLIDQHKLQEKSVYVLNRAKELPNIEPGKISQYAGLAAYEYLCHAIDDANNGHLRAIVTAPLNKAAMHAAGIDFPGHTEILAERTNTKNYAMMMANNELRILLVTIHIALAEVPKAITIENELNTIRLAHKACIAAGIQAPRIAVAGLNPHASENGKFGNEEALIIQPAIDLARAEKINVSEPLPGDTVFMRARQGEFDIVVAQYHDQGLIPVKYMGLDNGVNITVGLPFIRTSVDHGTAFDIAGKNLADPESLRSALNMAIDMTKS